MSPKGLYIFNLLMNSNKKLMAKGKMQIMKIKLPLFLLVAVVLTAFLTLNIVSAAEEFSIDELIVNDVKIVDAGSQTGDKLVVEAGDTLFMTVKLIGNETIHNDIDGFEDDVSVEAEIRGIETGTINAETSLFTVRAGKTYVKHLTLKIPENVKLANDIIDDFTLRIRAESSHVTETINIPLTIERPRHKVLLLDVQAPNKVNTGDSVLVEAVVRNRGSKVEQDVFVRASIPELGITKQKFLGDLAPLEQDTPNTESFDSDLTDKAVAFIRLDIPSDVASGEYALVTKVYTLDGLVESEQTTSITVEGIAQQIQPTTSVNVDATSKAVAKEQGVVYKITVTNNEANTKVFTAEVSGVDFGTSSVNPSVLTLSPGSSGEFNVFVSPSESATLGSHTFSVTVKADGSVVKTLNLNADVTQPTTQNRLKQNLIVIAVILVVILIILAIIIAVITGRRPEEGEEKLY